MNKARFDAYDGEGVTIWHDGFGRPVTTLLNLGGQARYLSHYYDADGRRLMLTHPDGVIFGYGYDPLGRITAVHDKGSATSADDLIVRY